MELGLRLGNDQNPPPPPSSSSHPTPLHFSLSFSSILQPCNEHQPHNHKHQNHLLPLSLNSSPPPAATSRRSSQTEGSEGAGVFTEVISGAAADDEGGGELGRSNGIVWSIRNNREEREEEEDEEEEETNLGSRKKLRLTRQQSAFLEESFKQHHTLYPKQKLEVARRLNLRPRQVEVWFQNRRARTKLKQTEVECEYLKKYCATLTQQNTKLQKELQDLRALKTTHSLFMHSPATTLTLCASCERAAATPNSR
ncbi:homeobox-leucine zipper protein HOX11-like [Benincasa hispida]|uniref:homeobox-leucine zipper protein HOX11-like n=1 Tax=Benincasa hispida TaxID=102211 RepID=UPI0019022AF6|nr:homeobox-leucine zipper protein HOX11-like [Benincasa hispida]